VFSYISECYFTLRLRVTVTSSANQIRRNIRLYSVYRTTESWIFGNTHQFERN